MASRDRERVRARIDLGEIDGDVDRVLGERGADQAHRMPSDRISSIGGDAPVHILAARTRSRSYGQ